MQRIASAVDGANVGDTGGEHCTEQDATREVASLPGVIDLLERREAKATGPELVDDVDVFERYYAEHPDADGFEVFDE